MKRNGVLTVCAFGALFGLVLAVASGARTGPSAVSPAQAGMMPTAVPARTADSFVDSIGVTVHLTYTDTSYGNYPQLKARLRELGVRHVGTSWGPDQAYAGAFARELAALGMRIYFGMGNPDYEWTPAQMHRMIRAADTLPMIEAVVAVNEWDVSGRPDWAQELRDRVAEVARVMRSDPATARIPIVAPPLAETENPAPYREVGDLSAHVDFANTHDYPGGIMMSDQILDTVLANAAIIAPGRPVIADETGYSTALRARDALHPPVAEEQGGILIPRLLFEHYRRGIVRTYLYEMVDQNPDSHFESNFGLVRHDYTPKPAFTAVRNLITLLRDPGRSFTPRSLSYALTGGDARTRTVLLQKHDGTFWLAVWQQTEVWDAGRLRPLNPRDVPVTLTLAAPAAQLRLYRPNQGVNPVATVADTASLPFPSSARITLVEIKPR